MRGATKAVVRRSRARRTVAAIAILTLALTLGNFSEAAVQRVAVMAKKGIGEFQPARGNGYFGWEQNSKSDLDHYNAYARRDGAQPFKVNARGTQGALGGISGNLLTYQEYRGRNSNIRFMNLVTRKRSSPQIFVNTRRWEYWPSLSGKWLLFGRRNLRGDKRRIILFNRDSLGHRILDRTSSASTFSAPGQVNGNWAVWHRCKPPTKCDVYRFNIELGAAKKVPNVTGRSQYAASVTSEGVVFFARGHRTCGKRVRFMRYQPGKPPTTLLRLRRNRDVGDSYTVTTPTGRTEVFFEQNACGKTRQGSDIYKLRFTP